VMPRGVSRSPSNRNVIWDIGYWNTMDLILAYVASLLLLVGSAISHISNSMS
jgi:hypothetical protein